MRTKSVRRDPSRLKRTENFLERRGKPHAKVRPRAPAGCCCSSISISISCRYRHRRCVGRLVMIAKLTVGWELEIAESEHGNLMMGMTGCR